MSDPDHRNLEREADEARKKLADAEQRADETLKDAAEELQDLTEDQTQRAERLRKQASETTGPILPQEPASPTDPGKPDSHTR